MLVTPPLYQYKNPKYLIILALLIVSLRYLHDILANSDVGKYVSAYRHNPSLEATNGLEPLCSDLASHYLNHLATSLFY